MAVRIKLDNDALAKLSAVAQSYIEEDVLPTAVSRAKRIVPVDTRALQNSIHAETGPDGNFLVADTDYAAYVELGTSRMSAQPYLRPAITSALPERSGNA